MKWFCRKHGINSCGGELPDRMSKKVVYASSHSKNELILSFSSTLKKPSCIASWGIDDVEIYFS